MTKLETNFVWNYDINHLDLVSNKPSANFRRLSKVGGDQKLIWHFSVEEERRMETSPSVEEIHIVQRAQNLATVLVIGMVTPSNVVYQADYPDYYFRITKSKHMTELKEKFRQMFENSMSQKRYMHLTEDLLKENPNICEYIAPSLDARQDMVVEEVPKLGKEAASKAIKE